MPAPIEPEPVETVQEVAEKRMVALKGARRTKLDVPPVSGRARVA
jgi:hypothetical protein